MSSTNSYMSSQRVFDNSDFSDGPADTPARGNHWPTGFTNSNSNINMRAPLHVTGGELSSQVRGLRLGNGYNSMPRPGQHPTDPSIRPHSGIQQAGGRSVASSRIDYSSPPPPSQYSRPHYNNQNRDDSVLLDHHEFQPFPSYTQRTSAPPINTQQSTQSTSTQSTPSSVLSKRSQSDCTASTPTGAGGGRGPTFNKASLEQLCRSWINVSEDSIVGNDQKGSTFWKKLTEDFNNRLPLSNHRSLKSLESRWGSLNHAMAKFAGYLQQIQMLRETGKGPHDQFLDALDMYSTEIGPEFKFISCFEIVKNSPKWKSNSTVLEHCAQHGVDNDFASPHDLLSTSDSSSNSKVVDLDSLPSMDRPEGNKKAKRNRNTKGTEEVQPQIVANQAHQLRVTERMADQGERATTALERMVELSVLMIDTSKLDERSRAGIEAAKARINQKNEEQENVI